MITPDHTHINVVKVEPKFIQRVTLTNFFKNALELLGKLPEKVTSDKHQLYPRSIKEVPIKEVLGKLAGRRK